MGLELRQSRWVGAGLRESASEDRLLRALAIVEPSVRASQVLDEALRNAGRLDVPDDDEALRPFVMGPLREAMRQLAGEEAAMRMVAALARHHGWRATMTGMAAASSDPGPSSTPPQSTSAPRVGVRRRRGPKTVAYLDVGGRDRLVDVVIMDPRAERADAIAEVLDQHGIFVAPLTDLEVAVELCASVGPSLVLCPGELEAEHVAALVGALQRSEAPGQLRHYVEAGGIPVASAGASPPLRYASVDQLVERVVQLLGDGG